MTSPDSNSDTTSDLYHVQIENSKGTVIGDRAHVVQHFYDAPSEPQEDLIAAEETYRRQVVETYKWLNFGGFDRPDLSLANVPLEDVFVRLTLTVEKVTWEPGPSESRQRERAIMVQEPIELGQALSSHLLIAGEPGAGKSTLLRWLAVIFAQGHQRESTKIGVSADADRLPVLVELGRLPERYIKSEHGEKPNWLRLLPEYLPTQMNFTSTPPRLLTQALADGRCLLIFDGLDEIADRQVRARIARSLVDLAHFSPGNRVIIGSRPSGITENEGMLHPQFKRCQIERFSPEDIRRFFLFWYALDRNQTPEQQRNAADELYTRVQATPAIMQLASTPLLTTILMLIWRNEGDLPERRVDLYKRCCRVLIEYWEASHDVAHQEVLTGMRWEDHLRLLTPLAYAIHSQEQRTSATREELIPLLVQALQDAGYVKEQVAATRTANQFLDALGLRSGLLQYIGDDRYSFPHLTFQEYLAARYIAEQSYPDYIDLTMVHLHEGWWREVHLLTIAHLGSGNTQAQKASDLILTILGLYASPSWIWRSPPRNCWLRLVVPGKFLPQLRLEQRIAWLLAREFELAIQGYAECAPNGTTAKVRKILLTQAVSLVQEIIYDEDRCRGQGALLTNICRSLQHQGDETVMKALLKMVRDQGWYMHERATKLLEQVGKDNETVVKALLEMLHDQNRSVQSNAARLLERLGVGNEVVITALLEMLHDADEYVRGSALICLVRMGVRSEVVVKTLLEMLHHQEFSRRWSWSTKVSLEQVGANDEAVVKALLEMLHDQKWFVQHAASELLGQVGAGNEKVMKTLLEMLHDADGHVRASVTELLGQLGVGNEDVVKALLGMLQDAEGFVRRRVATSLGQVGAGNEVVAEALVEMLHDDEESIRAEVAKSLGQVGVGSQDVVKALLEMLHDQGRSISHYAAESLGQVGVGNEVVVKALLEMLHEENGYLRWKAAGCLGQVGVGSQDVVKALLEMLHDQSWSTSHYAAKSLGKVGVGNEILVETLLEMLHDSDHSVRYRIVGLLGKVGAGNQAVIKALLEILHHTGTKAPWAKVPLPSLIKALLELRYVQPRNLVDEAIESLAQLGEGNEALVETLLEMLHDQNWLVRSRAAELLGKLEINNEVMVNALLERLHVGDMEDIIYKLGRIEVKDTNQLHRILVALNGCLYYLEFHFEGGGRIREATLASIQQLLNGRPIPGYRWVSLRKQRAQRLLFKCIAFWNSLSSSAVGLALAIVLGLALTPIALLVIGFGSLLAMLLKLRIIAKRAFRVRN